MAIYSCLVTYAICSNGRSITNVTRSNPASRFLNRRETLTLCRRHCSHLSPIKPRFTGSLTSAVQSAEKEE